MRLRHVVATTVACLSVAGATNAAADGLDLDVWGARDIARAGATVVSEDGGAALLVNPAGMVRRTQLRIQIGMAFHDDDLRYRAPNAGALGSPVIEDRAAAQATPSLAIQTKLGPFVVGAAYIERGDLQRTFPFPAGDQPADQVTRLFPHRYAGVTLRFQRRSLSMGIALRPTSWLGIGVSTSVEQISLAESRYIWAGFEGRDGLANPRRDLRLLLDGRDNFVPGANLGFLIAPPALPIEMALSASWTADAHLDGTTALLPRTPNTDFPRPEQIAPTATTILSTPLRLRAGLRYLGDRFFFEVNAEIGVFIGDHDAPEWRLQGVFVRDETLAIAELATVPSLIDRRSYAGARGAVDVEVISGFLWLTAGYAYRTAASRRAKVTAAFADFGGHTVALGAEGHWNGMTLTVGYARFMQPTTTVTNSIVALPNPFNAGNMAIGNGRYERSRDAFGAALEISWD